MVLVSCVLLVGTPLQMVRTTLTELLEGAPPDTTRTAVDTAVTGLAAAFGLRDPVVYSTKVGPKLYVELEAAADPSVTIAQVAQVREDLHRRLADLPYELWLTVELTPQHHEEELP
jgi:predicted Co/Zn/Cd cation transporter (cation efflux family)